MKERPIIMSGDNPKLILEGRKTQTRRIMKPQPIKFIRGGKAYDFYDSDGLSGIEYDGGKGIKWYDCPYGVAGDRLWVRETWRVASNYDLISPSDLAREEPATYRSVAYLADGDTHFNGRTRSSIHMPRWASRITLEITKVRVERLQDITNRDAEKEGMRGYYKESDGRLPRDQYAVLWDSIHGKGAWDKSPWVWVIEFRKL